MGTVICSSSRLLATLVLLSTRPTLSLEDTASWRRPMARLFSLAVDRLRRLMRGWDKRPMKNINESITTLSSVLYRSMRSFSSTFMYVALRHRAQTDSCLSLLLTTCCIRLQEDGLNPHMPSERCYRWLITTGRGWHLSLSIASSFGLMWSVRPICASVPDAVANSMSLLLALRISSFFSVSSSARQQMISSLWKNKHTQYDHQTPESRVITFDTSAM